MAKTQNNKTTTKKKKRASEPKQKKAKSSRKTLTSDIAEQMKTYWMLGGKNTLSDEEITERVGITMGQLRGWLDRNTPTKVVWNGEQTRLGLRDLRTRARAQLKAGYLARLNNLAQSAENEGDYRDAANIYMWLLERQFPLEFGHKAGKHIEKPEGPKAVKLPFMPKKQKNG